MRGCFRSETYNTDELGPHILVLSLRRRFVFCKFEDKKKKTKSSIHPSGGVILCRPIKQPPFQSKSKNGGHAVLGDKVLSPRKPPKTETLPTQLTFHSESNTGGHFAIGIIASFTSNGDGLTIVI